MVDADDQALTLSDPRETSVRAKDGRSIADAASSAWVSEQCGEERWMVVRSVEVERS